MQKRVVRSSFSSRRIIMQTPLQLFLHAYIGKFSQEFWSNIFPFPLRKLSHLKADAAVLHHAEEDFLFVRCVLCRIFGVVPPDEHLKQLSGKPPLLFF